MSIVESNTAVAEMPEAHAGHNHDPHLAHHFDTPDHQYQSAKLGMWVFLGTEVLMFGGLFCGYAVYRHNHPEMFAYAHQYLNRTLGAINTLVLITSSLTMAWGVRAAQMGKRGLLSIMLILTLVGGAVFMGIKFDEWKTKWNEQIFEDAANVFRPNSADTTRKQAVQSLEEEALHIEPPPKATPRLVKVEPEVIDPNAGTADAALIKAPNVTPAGLAPKAAAQTASEKLSYEDLNAQAKHRVYTFFTFYFFMTGLHGVHVLVGMALITWLLIRALRNDFSPKYFTPVDLVGLYWHLVDIIWIFLFPLLYLIH